MGAACSEKLGDSGLYGPQSYSYDGVGNRTSRVLGSTTETYGLASTANQIASISTTIAPFTPTPATYLSNGFQQRVQKIVGTTTTQFIYDKAGHLLEEADGSGAVQKEYIWLDDMPVGLVDDTGASPVVYFIHSDQINSPQKVSDGSASIVWDGVFDPFGNPVSRTGGAMMNLRFPGQYFDAESGFNQNWLRSYDPNTGRYIQSDPIGLRGGINTYAYVSNNPVTNTDPMGLFAVGFSAELSAILPTSGGGPGIFGYNFEYTSDAGWHLYKFSTPKDCNPVGFNIGASASANFALGNGSWTGPFNNIVGSYGYVTGSAFYSPQGTGNWKGLSVGGSLGAPGAGEAITSYSYWH